MLMLKTIWKSKDVPSAILLGVIVLVAAWIIALPISSTVQDCYLKRFHLASDSFCGWAIQQPVPSMYNLENRYWQHHQQLTPPQLAETAAGDLSSIGQGESLETKMLNHFPGRIFTFSDGRYRMQQQPVGFFHLSSRYRDREIRTVYQYRAISENDFQAKRVGVAIE